MFPLLAPCAFWPGEGTGSAEAAVAGVACDSADTGSTGMAGTGPIENLHAALLKPLNMGVQFEKNSLRVIVNEKQAVNSHAFQVPLRYNYDSLGSQFLFDILLCKVITQVRVSRTRRSQLAALETYSCAF